MYAIGPAGTQDSRIWVASVPNRNRAGSAPNLRIGKQ